MKTIRVHPFLPGEASISVHLSPRPLPGEGANQEVCWYKIKFSLNNFQNKRTTHKLQTLHKPISRESMAVSFGNFHHSGTAEHLIAVPDPLATSTLSSQPGWEAAGLSSRTASLTNFQASPWTCPHNRFLERVPRDLQLQAYY